jgi:hypothetical protein
MVLGAETFLHKTNLIARLSQHKTTFVERVCEGIFLPERNEGRKTTAAALKSLALKKL